MKQFLSLIGLLLSSLLYAQAPQFIHYQAVIRDANGAVLSNQTITLKLEITQGQNTYTEIRTVTTNNVGLVNLNIGSLPAPNSIPFTDIDWASGNTSFITWYDPTNTQNNWQYIGNSSIASVPYALYAENGFSGDFNDLTNVPNLDTSISNELQSLSYYADTIFLSNGGGFVYFPTFSGDFNDLTNIPSLDTSNTNELQALSQSGDTISLSNGGGAVVVPSFSGDFGDLVNVPYLDTSNTNELQVLSISGDTIFLSGGGFVVLPLSLKAEQINDLSDGKTSNTSLALGANALQNNSVGINNTAVGQNALMLDTIGTGNTAVGFESLKNSGHSDENTAIGQQSLKSNVHGSYNVAVGYKASENNFTGEHNTALGHSALMTNSVGVENTAIGKNSQKFSTVDGNTSVGANSLANNTTGNSNVAIGLNALNENILGSSNTAVGKNALKHTNGNYNTALGTGALEMALGSSNTAIGANSLKDYVGPNFGFNTRNVAIGNNAGIDLKYGIWNVLIGSNISARGKVDNNVIIGTNAGDLDSLSTGNVFIGNSTKIGHNASKLGYFNTVIGTMAFAGSGAAYSTGDSVYNSVALGYKAWAKESNTIQLGNSAITNVNTFGSLRAGDTASSVQDKGLLVYGSTSGPTGPTGQFIRSKDRNNVLTFLDLDEENGGSVGLYSTSYQGTNFVGISAKNASGWTRPLIVELGASTNSLVIKESESVELVDGTIVKEISDTTTVSESAALEVKSTSKGLLPPRMNANQRNAISNPKVGLMLYCLDCGPYGELNIYNGSFWSTLTGDTAALPDYNLYDTGSFGGIIFYINPNASTDGWKYLELYPQKFASEKWQNDSSVNNAPYFFSIPTISAFGGGKFNKQLMQGHSPIAENQSIPNPEIWYVPSLIELEKIYSRVAGILQALGQNAGSNSIFHTGQFWNNFWTSTEMDANNAYRVNFNGGGTHTSTKNATMPFLLITKY